MKKIGTILPVLTLTFVACAGPDVRKGPGADYFRPDFECRKGSLDKEKNPAYLLLREEYRREAFANPPQQRPFLLIAGESTAALFSPTLIQAEIPGFLTVNRAIGGETTALLLNTADQDIIPLKPDVIFLSIGGNDILGGRCLSNIKENISLFLFKIRNRLPRTHVILAGVPPVLSWKVNSVTPYFNAMLRDLAAENSPFVEYFDLWEILADPDRPVLQKRFARPLTADPGVPGKLIQSGETNFDETKYDRIHFNDFGYKEIARRLRPRLERIRSENNLH